MDNYAHAIRKAVSNMYHNPPENFDRGVNAMIKVYQDLGGFDYGVVIGKGGLAENVVSQADFEEVILNLNLIFLEIHF